MTEYLSRMLNIERIYANLVDDESKVLLDARLSLLFDSDMGRWWNAVKGDRAWRLGNTELFQSDEYIIFGAGSMGRYLESVLETTGKNVKCYIDNGFNDNINDTKEVIRPDRFNEYISDNTIPIVLCSRNYETDMKNQLSELGIKNPIIPEPNVCAFCGNQYFDVVEPTGGTFIDCGGYIGDTVEGFVEWTRDKGYHHIYSFEPVMNNYKKELDYINREGIKDCDVINKGISSGRKKMTIKNEQSAGGAYLDESDEGDLETISLDDFLDGREATYIKMDIEGMEGAAIEGASNTIKKYKPKLAICIYHKPFDFIDIPLQILKLRDDYRFFIRHYASNLCETVLYAE